MNLAAFISSSIEEFGPEQNPDSTRRKVAKLFEEFNVEPVMWEFFKKPASMTTKEFYQNHLQDCQLYIGMIGLKDSLGTEDEYNESRKLGLETWIFIYEPKDEFSREPQIQALANLASSETVRTKFASESQLLDAIRLKLKSFLPEKVAEYIELRKKRAHEFWSSYISDFLEPLLTELKVILSELNEDASSFTTDSWRQIKQKPSSDLDQDLAKKIKEAYDALEDYQRNWQIAYQLFKKQANITIKRYLKSNEQQCWDVILGKHVRLINTAMQPDIPQRWDKMEDFPNDLYPRIDALSAPGIGDKLISEFVGGLSISQELKNLRDTYKIAVANVRVAYNALWTKFTYLVAE